MEVFKYLLLVVAPCLAASCATYKDIAYFQDIDSRSLSALSNEYEAIIKKDDRLSIIVSGPDKTVTAPYNLTLGEMSGSGYTSSDPDKATLSYLVDREGNIDFPILGTVHVEGMTRKDLVNYLTREKGQEEF